MKQVKKFPTTKYTLAPISDEADYQRACDILEELDDLDFADDGEEQKKMAYLDALTTLVEAYETKSFDFNKTELTLVQVIEQALDQLNLTKKDLAKMLGSNRVTEIFQNLAGFAQHDRNRVVRAHNRDVE